MHLAVLYQFYQSPDCGATGRHHTLFRHLAERHRITLITSRTWYDRRITRDFDWVPSGVDVQMVDVPYANRMGPAGRVRAFASFAGKALMRSFRVDRPDLLWGVSVPLTVPFLAAVVARRFRVPWIFEVKDLWPDFPIQMGALRNPLLRKTLRGLERGLYRDAARVVTLSEDMTAHVRRFVDDPAGVFTIPNGTDFDLIDGIGDSALTDLRRRYDLADRTVILYAGTFGRANDIPTLCKVFRTMADRDDLRFVVAGDGYYEPLLRETVAGQQNVLVLPPQARPAMLSWFKLAALSLVTFIDLPVLAVNSPGKFFDSLGCGTPVIVTNPGWTKRYVERERCGWAIPASSPDQLTAKIAVLVDRPDWLAEAGGRAQEAARRDFDRTLLARQFEDVLLEAAEAHARG